MISLKKIVFYIIVFSVNMTWSNIILFLLNIATFLLGENFYCRSNDTDGALVGRLLKHAGPVSLCCLNLDCTLKIIVNVFS